MNNIFEYAPKELVMDAFFAWIFQELNNNLSEYKVQFLNDLRIEGFTNESQITKIEKQTLNTDLLITIDSKKILFENKTSSTIHSNQLERYKKSIPNCHQYIYMKLAFIDYEEKLKAIKNGYLIVGIEDIKKALTPLKDCCQIVEQYYNFLNKKYIQKFKKIQDGILTNNEKIYSYSEAQRFFLSSLHEKLYEKIEFLKFKHDANKGGTPWTQLTIAYTANIYGEKGESIFWRIDKKKNMGYYIKLTQYADISDNYKEKKRIRLDKLRKEINFLLNNYSDFCKEKPSNKGTKSSEIAIFYFSENEYEVLFPILEKLSIIFYERYKTL